MKYVLPIGIALGVLAVVFAAGQQNMIGDPASLGLFGTGLIALGIARRQQDEKSSDV